MVRPDEQYPHEQHWSRYRQNGMGGGADAIRSITCFQNREAIDNVRPCYAFSITPLSLSLPKCRRI